MPDGPLISTCDRSACRLFSLHKRFANLDTSKNASCAIRPWGLERAPNTDLPCSKREDAAIFSQLLTATLTVSRFLFKGREFTTQRGGPNLLRQESYGLREILDVLWRRGIFPVWEFLDYDWGPSADVFLDHDTVPAHGDGPWYFGILGAPYSP